MAWKWNEEDPAIRRRRENAPDVALRALLWIYGILGIGFLLWHPWSR